MSVEIYKAGNTDVVDGVKCEIARVDHTALQRHLDIGYVLDVNELCPASEEPEVEVEVEVEPDNSAELSNEELRGAAKKAGIEDWKTARFAKLRELLGYESTEE